MDIVTYANGALTWDYTALVTPIMTGFVGAVCAGIIFFVARKVLRIVKRHSLG